MGILATIGIGLMILGVGAMILAVGYKMFKEVTKKD